MIYKKIYISVVLSLLLTSCFSTSPNNVKIGDANNIGTVDYGTIKASMPVKIKGEGNWVGATAGAMLGGLLGTAICGEKEISGTKCQDIGIIFGTVGGAAAGTVTQGILGNHDGFQYIVKIDNKTKDSAFVQGDKEALKNNQRVVIIYGETVRILPYEN